MHEYRNIEQENIKGSSDRALGIVFGVVFALMALWPLAHGKEPRLWAFAVSASFFFLAAVFPRALGPLNKAWTRFGLLLHTITTPLLMGFVFFGVITPMGLVMRLCGKTTLALKYSDRPSYWIERAPADTESFTRQF